MVLIGRTCLLLASFSLLPPTIFFGISVFDVLPNPSSLLHNQLQPQDQACGIEAFVKLCYLESSSYFTVLPRSSINGALHLNIRPLRQEIFPPHFCGDSHQTAINLPVLLQSIPVLASLLPSFTRPLLQPISVRFAWPAASCLLNWVVSAIATAPQHSIPQLHPAFDTAPGLVAGSLDCH